MGILRKARRLARILLVMPGLALAGPMAGEAPAQPASHGMLVAATAASPLSDRDVADPRTASAPSSVLRTGIISDLSWASSRREPFDVAAPAESFSYSMKWHAAAAGIATDIALVARCRAAAQGCSEAASRFMAIVEQARDKDGRARLGEVNRAINLAIRFTSDAVQHGMDVWASPLATLASGQGDCEDYAILKFMALRELGIDASDLRLVVLRDARLQQDHAVLAARLDGRWIVLDNRRLVLLEDEALHGYTALAAFGADGDPELGTAFADNGAGGTARPVRAQALPAAPVNPS
jgi:predicted transglutaminase-like cysteine proteinase